MGREVMSSDRGSEESAEPAAPGPLQGYRILDFSIALTGPYAVALLADQGASVVKVERPGIGDVARWIGVSVNRMSAFFLACNRGKKSIVLDLHRPQGAELARKLAADVDVVVENFRPGVMDKLGLGYDAIREFNPEVVYASLTGYGPIGPYRNRPAYDTAIQAFGGFAANQADPEDGVPVFLRQAAADKVTALYASQAITAALLARERRGGGQHVQVTMADSVVSFLWAESAGNEVLLDADGSSHSSFVAGFSPFRFTDGWGIAVPTSVDDFSGMCKALGVDGYDDPRIATLEERQRHRDVTEPLMDRCYAMAAHLTMSEASRRFEEHGVPFAMVLSPAEIVDDPQARAMKLFEERQHPIAGPTRLPRHPARFSTTPASLAANAPGLGEHTDEILASLGMGDRIDELRQSGVVG
jgi:crotonobetainyl-CoA:carnitine CoA-transferase CaiB-like acyl-CoA transferase